MFYELEALENQLKCPVCLKKFNSPRILPCGKSVCLNCIEECIKNDSLVCPLCHKNHVVPSDGFILNEFILVALQLKPQKVYRCPSFEKFDQLLTKIKLDLVEIEEKLERPADKIVEYCDRLRNQIDIRTEILIDKLNMYRSEFLDEVKKFEQACLQNSITTEMRQLFSANLSSVAVKLETHFKYINQARLDETVVKKMLAEARINEFNLKNYEKLLESKIFGPKKIHFDESNINSSSSSSGDEFGPSVLGKLNYEELKFDENMINPDKLTQIVPEKSVECKVNVDRVLELDNKYVVSSDNTIKIFEKDSEILGEIRFDQNPECLLTNGTDLIFVQHTRNIWKNNRKEKSTFSSLSIYDLNLSLKSEISPDFTILSCCCTNHSIFVQAERTMVISVYNWCLEKITSFGQIHFLEKPYFFKDACLSIVKDDRIYMRKAWPQLAAHEQEREENSSFIRVVSLTSGELITQYSLSLRGEYFIIDGLDRTIVIDIEDSWLKVYDNPKQKFDQVELIYEKEIDGLKDVADLRMNEKGRLCFIKNKNLIEYVSFYS